MSNASDDLHRLLAEEIERRLPLVQTAASDPAATADLRAALHSLRGSAALAGQHDLSLVIAHLAARLYAGQTSVRTELSELLQAAAARLREGLPAFATHWPQPPPALGPAPLDAKFRSEYQDSIRDHLLALDAAVAAYDDPMPALEKAYRSVHAIKAAAAAVGDDPTIWYCHGLETRLKPVLSSRTFGSDALLQLARHRAILGMLLEEPAQALETLRAMAERRPLSTLPPPNLQPGDDAGERSSMLRVPSRSADRLLDQLERLSALRDEMQASAAGFQQGARRLRAERSALLEVFHLLGQLPQEPLIGSAMQRIEHSARKLRRVANAAERSAYALRHNAALLRAGTGEMRSELTGLRLTTLRWLFDRIARGLSQFAARESKFVQLIPSGSELSLDRRVAERLFDPLMQLVRNAVAHGIELPEDRIRSGKPRSGLVYLRAERIGEWLRFEVEDDGRGVDLDKIRKLAVQQGALSEPAAARAEADELLSLLFVPGLSTHEDADLLAGRGVGLNVARDMVRQLGGAMRLRSRPGTGLAATIEIPYEAGQLEVLWLKASGHEFALPTGFTGEITTASPERRAVRLDRCLRLPSPKSPAYHLDLVIGGIEPIVLAIDDVGCIEAAMIRTLPPLIAAAGPYVGAVLRADGSLRLVLDAPLIAARAWALAA